MVWIPDKKLVKDAPARKRFDLDDMERSVTAPEIEYGALRDKSQLSRTVFYFRAFDCDVPDQYGRITGSFNIRIHLMDFGHRFCDEKVTAYSFDELARKTFFCLTLPLRYDILCVSIRRGAVGAEVLLAIGIIITWNDACKVSLLRKGQ